jgi:hypothetical protein
MKYQYRYPFKIVWLPALLFALCLSITLVSTVAWLITAAANDTSGSYPATVESVIPALLVLIAWIGCAILAGRMRLKPFLWAGCIFWGLETILYLLCLTPLYQTGIQLALSMLTLPLWSYFALVAMLDVQSSTAQSVLAFLPTLLLTAVYVWQMLKAHGFLRRR